MTITVGLLHRFGSSPNVPTPRVTTTRIYPSLIPLTKHDVYIADECFLTGTAAELVPVVRVDCRTIGDGVPGPITRKLTAAYRELTQKS